MIKYAHSSISRAYSEEFKQEALRMLNSGQTIRQVAYLMHVPTTTLKRWQSEAKSDSNQPPTGNNRMGKRRVYAASIKAEALQRIRAGQSITLLSKEMTIPTYTLYIWKRTAQVSTRYPAARDQSSSQSYKSNEKQQPTVGTKGINRELFEEEFKQRALKKLRAGHRTKKVAQGMGVSISTLNSWLRHFPNTY